MRLQQIQNSYLYEGLDRSSTNTMLLWESAGLKLREAALSPDQIQQVFAAVEKGATDAGSNRTMLGKGKDAAVAVNQAWEDLKTKVQNSGPVKAIDQKFDDVVAKIEAGLGGPDNKVNQVIQKYRKFAKDRPISQGLIYAALIAAAGISGAGLGGAAVLGLLKMTDKLLQGEKFSSAAYAGAKTGAISAVAGQIGQAVKGGDAAVSQAAGSAVQDKGEVFNLTGQTPDAAGAADTAKTAAGAADSSASTSAGAASGVGDKNAKYAWQLVQQKVDAGELTDPKAVSSELNKSLNKAFSDYGVNPNSPEAEASKNAAKEVIAKAKDPESLLGKMQSGEVRPAGPAPDTLKGADALKAASDTATGSSDPFTVNGQTMKASLKDTIMKMPDEDGEKAYNAWKVLVGDAPTQDKMNAGNLLQQLEKKYADMPRVAPSADTTAAAADATKTAASGVKGAAGELLKYVGQEAPDGVIKNVAPDGKWIEYTSPTGRVVRDSFPIEMNGKTFTSAGPYLKALLGAPTESVSPTGKRLSEGQVYLVFNRVCSLNESLLIEGVLREGPLDALKGFAAKGLQKAQTVGKNLTTKVTADKLNKAWQKAGSPTDSEELASFLTAQGVNSGVVNNVYQSLKIAKASPASAKSTTPASAKSTTPASAKSTTPASATKTSAPGIATKTSAPGIATGQSAPGIATGQSATKTSSGVSSYAEVKAQIMKLDKKGRQRLMTYLNKQLGTV